MSLKNIPPYLAHFDGNQVPSITGVEGTLGTNDAGGTARVIPIGVNPATGAMYAELVGASANDPQSGTLNDVTITALPDPLGSVVVTAGTVTTSLALNTGTITTIVAGTQNTLGTVGVVNNLVKGTITKLEGGTLDAGTVVVSSLPSSGTLLNLATGTIASVGTAVGVGVVTTVTTVSNLTSGSVRMTVGTLTTGTLQNLVTGTINALASGTITGGTLGNLVSGTINALASGTITAGTFRSDTRPVGSLVQSTHTLGTGGGTFVGTLVAPTGAGTKLYLTGLSIVGRSGTADCGIANNVAGTTGAGVYARGAFQPGGGISREFSTPIELGTNGTLAYFIKDAGTVDFTVSYIVST